MAKFKVTVPPTKDVGSYSCIVSAGWNTNIKQEALCDYNSCRAHDCLPAVKRMPKGTKYVFLSL